MITDAKKRVLVRKVCEVLKEDILNRYDNNEYWDFELDAVADILIGLSEKERYEVLKLVR
jgi:hypothetical protein